MVVMGGVRDCWVTTLRETASKQDTSEQIPSLLGFSIQVPGESGDLD